MTNPYLILGDIAGQYDNLKQLTEYLPPETTVISVGDAIDKGPYSKQVIDYFKNRPHSYILIGNHELLLLNSLMELDKYQSLAKLKYCNFWLESQGIATLLSYCPEASIQDDPISALLQFKDTFEKAGHRTFLQSCPFLFVLPGLIITHAPASIDWLPRLLKDHGLESQACQLGFNLTSRHYWIQSEDKKFNIPSLNLNLFEFVSCRKKPKAIPNYQHIFGHVSKWGYKKFGGKKKSFTNLCIDTSSKDKLTAVFWPSLEKVKSTP